MFTPVTFSIKATPLYLGVTDRLSSRQTVVAATPQIACLAFLPYSTRLPTPPPALPGIATQKIHSQESLASGSALGGGLPAEGREGSCIECLHTTPSPGGLSIHHLFILFGSPIWESSPAGGREPVCGPTGDCSGPRRWAPCQWLWGPPSAHVECCFLLSPCSALTSGPASRARRSPALLPVAPTWAGAGSSPHGGQGVGSGVQTPGLRSCLWPVLAL